VTAIEILEAITGFVLVIAVFYDVFQSVVLPRPAINKFILVRFLFRATWVMWRWLGMRMSPLARRERWLAAFGPVGVLMMFTIWALGFGLGYALMVDGVRDQLRPPPDSLGTSIYFSATTLVPLSYGDLVPIGPVARIVTIAESATGVFIAALAITLLFSLYESFQEREELVVSLDAIGGAPPSGLQILETAGERGMHGELMKMFDDWREWAAAVLESHLAYPILVYFRSSHDNEAWLNSFWAVMDAATLVISTVDDDAEGPARLMFTVGNHLVEDLSWYFRLKASEDPLLTRAEFDQASERLTNAGHKCRSKGAAWPEFSSMRASYAMQLRQMTERLAITPAPWIGDRSYVPHERAKATRQRGRSKAPVRP
jgi:hypothetical protein